MLCGFDTQVFDNLMWVFSRYEDNKSRRNFNVTCFPMIFLTPKITV